MKFSLGSCKAVEVSEVHIVRRGDTGDARLQSQHWGRQGSQSPRPVLAR